MFGHVFLSHEHASLFHWSISYDVIRVLWYDWLMTQWYSRQTVSKVYIACCGGGGVILWRQVATSVKCGVLCRGKQNVDHQKRFVPGSRCRCSG